MKPSTFAHLAALLAATQFGLACNRFVWHEDPFTPDPAPTSELVVAGGDTTYVLERPSYYLLASERAALWNREVMDDVAWRYRALFGDAPPVIAVRLDSVVMADTTSTWRGVPFARVDLRRRAAAPRDTQKKTGDRAATPADSARARLLAGPLLAATAAQTWLGARTMEAARGPDSQPGGPVRPVLATASLPAWIEAGVLRLLGSGGAVDRANEELRADSRHVVPLASLFATAWTAPPNAIDIVRTGMNRFDLDDGERRPETAARARDRRDAAPGASPLFIAQAVSVLGFVHDRDPALVGRLIDELARGGSIPDVLASSATLPHDVAGLDVAWRDWLTRGQRARR